MTLKNVLIRLTAQLFYPLVFAVVTLTCMLVNIGQTYKIPIESNGLESNSAFNEKEDPIWLAHMTDLHISDLYPQAIQNTNDSFNYIHRYIKPSFLLITGDIGDNYDRMKKPRLPIQNIKDYKTYHSLKNSSGVNPYVFETIGNHDIYSITDITNANFGPYFTVNEISQSTVRFNEKTGVRVVGMNPIRFPSGVGTMGYMPKIDSSVVTNLEKSLTSSFKNESTLTVLASHFSSAFMYPKNGLTDATKLNFDDLLEANGVNYFINGHSHPDNSEIFHHKNKVLEITGLHTLKNEGFAIFTFDNGHANYKRFSVKKDNNPLYSKPAIITHPVPSTMENEIPQKFNGFVRLISFSDTNTETNAKVNVYHAVIDDDNNLRCDMTFVRNLASGNNDGHSNARLYECQIAGSASLPIGRHSLRVNGDLNESIEFTINEIYSVKEKQTTMFNGNSFTIGITLGLLYQFLLFLGLIFPFNAEVFYEYDEHFFYCLFLGPLFNGFRFKKLELWAKIVFALCVLWPSFLPIAFFETGGSYGHSQQIEKEQLKKRAVLSIWGYTINGRFVWDSMCMVLGVAFFNVTAIAIEELFYVCLTKWRVSYYLDVFVAVIYFAISIYVWFSYGSEVNFGSIYWFLNFPFVLLPLLAVAAVMLHRPLRKIRKIRDAERERQRGLNEELLNAEKGELEGDEDENKP